MSVSIQDEPSEKESFRETKRMIQVTNGKLWLVNYTDLTMVAQFTTSKIPSRDNSDLEIPLQNGNYLLTIRQMFDPELFNWQSPPDPGFEIIFTPNQSEPENHDRDVIWWSEDEK